MANGYCRSPDFLDVNSFSDTQRVLQFDAQIREPLMVSATCHPLIFVTLSRSIRNGIINIEGGGETIWGGL